MTIEDAKAQTPAGEPAKPKLEAESAAAPQTPPAAAAKPQHKESWWETIKTIGIALAIALVVRSFLYQPFNIPSESMKPTLLVGDFLFVSKFAYGYSRHSLPFSLPLIPGRPLFHEPTRGQVIVFKTPKDNRTDFIKRLIGLPGDRIQMQGGVLFICEAKVIVCETAGDNPDLLAPQYAVSRTYLSEYTSEDPRTGIEVPGRLYKETLPNGVSYTTLDLGQRQYDDTGIYTVPAGRYFMMGDNRDNSTDSRVPIELGGVGMVPALNLVGHAQLRFFSIAIPRPAWQVWRWPFGIRFGRMFTTIE